MKIWRIHSLKLENVKLKPIDCNCFMHDYEMLGVSVEDVRAELEGNEMLVYTGDFTGTPRLSKCPWCAKEFIGTLADHIFTHGKTMTNLMVYKFQVELYREKLRLLRAGQVDHTYFVYINPMCQFCANMTARGRGLCAIPESARNKVRSLIAMGFSADNFPKGFLKKSNIGYIVGRPI